MAPSRSLVVVLSLISLATGCAARPRLAKSLITEPQLAMLLTSSCPSPPNPAGTPAPCGNLGALDRLFTDAYQGSQDYTKQHHGPVVLVSGSNLVLMLEGAAPNTVRVIPDIYHALKAVAHLPFAIYLTARLEAGKQLSAATRQAFEAFLARESAARSDLSRFPLSTEQLARQRRILDTSVTFIRRGLEGGTVSREQLESFASAVGPLLLENTRDAGCAQVVATHRQMRAWRAAQPSLDWPSLVVVNRGAHQARYRNAATQYFAWLIGGVAPAWNYPGESMRVVYAEDIFPTPGTTPSGSDLSMEVFSTISLDSEASRAFFGRQWRLSEDVLSDGASVCVAQLPQAERWTR